MQRLSNRSIVVPDGFRYTVQETGYTVRARDYWSWMKKTRDHYKANEIPIPDDLDARMEDQLCKLLPPEWCARPNDASWINTRISWDDFANGMKAFVSLFLGGFDFVDQAEAERRAWLCCGCPMNVSLAGCGACRKMATLITGDVAKRTTPYDADLRACAICKCAVQSMVWFPMDALESADTPEHQALYPAEFCWKNKLSPTYRPNEQLAMA